MARDSDCTTPVATRRHAAMAICRHQEKISPQIELKAFLKNTTCGTLLSLGALVGLSVDHAVAADCGAPVGGVATCVAPGGNPYATGIIYNAAGVLVLNVGSGIVVNRTPGDENDGIQVRDESGITLTVNLADGVTITTDGLHADGLEVLGSSDIVINSAANITVNSDTTDFRGTAGLVGRINDAASTGNINITQLANSTITVTGDDGFGLYGFNAGTGSVFVTSSGSISTAGFFGYGLNAWNTAAGGANTTVTLNAPGSVFTDGINAVGLYSLNAGAGNALAFAHGKITTIQEGSDAVLTDIDNQNMSGASAIVLSNTAEILTMGDSSNGAWALNWGLGNASITSAATVTTQGTSAVGLNAEIRLGTPPDPAVPGDLGNHYRGGVLSAADALVHLEGSGIVVTGGASSHGIFANNQGLGAAIVTMDAGASVTTSGILANGVNGFSLGTVSLDQAVGSSIQVSGAQAFGVNLVGGSLASADIGGNVSATGQFGVGASAFATTGPTTIAVGANSTVTGGWQADVAGLGATTTRPSAGVLIGSGTAGQLTNLGIIGAASDRAIADIGRQAATAGNLTVANGGLVTGFVELATGGTNLFNNTSLFDVRHFADTNGDGVRDTKRVSISDFGAATSSFNNLSGATVRLAPVLGETAIDAAGYYIPTTGIDSRPLEAGFYTLGRSGVVQGQFTNLGTFHNAGILDLRGSAIGNTLMMTGNPVAGGAAGSGVFISDGGRLLLNTVLNEGVAAGGQTGSFSDVLVVDSTRMGTGATTITIDRREGGGAATPGNGILLVEVRNKAASAPGVFALNGDFIANGEQAVIGGAYYYNLFHNGVAGDAADGNWYLRNLGYSPNVPVYEEYPKVLLPLIEVPTLQQRVGNRYWNEPAPRAARTVFCKDASQNYECAVTDEQASYYVGSDGTVIIENHGMWGRIEGEHGHYESSLATGSAHYDTNSWKIQAGIDRLFFEGDRGKLIGGITVNYGHVSADVSAAGANGDIRTDGYGFGGTLTWYGTNGFYADGQAQATWLDSDLNSSTVGRRLVDGNNGFGYTLSLEAGQRIALNQHWTLTPQAQLVYSNVRFDSFTDPFGTTVSLSDGDSLRGRLGLAAEYQERRVQTNGTVSRISGYGIANLYNEFLDGTRVNVSGTDFSSRDDRLWGGLGLGGSYNWNDDKHSLYGEVSANTGLAHFGDSYDVGGTLGLRVKW